MMKLIKEEKKVLPECNFPTLWQTVIFRNIGMVPTDRIAKVLGCDEATVLFEAARLGLDNIEYEPEWEEKSYITIIRSNWFLLSTEQLLELLGYTEEQLFFTLRDEDFLVVKLGNTKPECEPVLYSPLTEEQIAETEEISAILATMNFGRGAKCFDFFAANKSGDAPAIDNCNTRFIHGYRTPCGDAFMYDSRDYLSDELLAEYKKQGVNGIWMHGLLATLSPYPYIPERSEGYKTRRKNLNELIERCAKFGIKVYIYFNEPRCLPLDVGPKFPSVTGFIHPRGYSMCMAYTEVHEYLHDAFVDLLRECPIGGIMTITMSENPTHCRSKILDSDCPRCKNTPFEDTAALVNNIIMKAIEDSGRDTELIANLWSWSTTRGWTEEQILSGIRQLDTRISVLVNSEFDLPIDKGGIKNEIQDYSISNPGPSPVNAKALKYAKSLGHKVYAKIQANNSWECSAVPYLPVFDLVGEHIKNLTDIGVENYTLSWTLGGYPSPTLNYIANFKNMTLDEWYAAYFGEYAETVKRGVSLVSDGFREFPFSCDHIYFSPQNIGPYNMWCAYPEEKRSTMVCFGFDDYELWTEKYPYEIFVSQTEKMLKLWGEGLEVLRGLEGVRDDIDALIRYTEAAMLHLRADLLQTKYAYMKRDIPKYRDELIKLANASAEDAKRLSYLANVDPTIGFEASNHYYYTSHLLKEKVLNVRKFIEKIKNA